MEKVNPAIVWFRQDLRLKDNPALIAASQSPVLAVYIWDADDPWLLGGAARWWLHHSLKSLQKSLNSQGVPLILKRGKPLEVLKQLADETQASSLYWNRCYEPYAIERDKKIKAHFKDQGFICESFKGSILIEPWNLLNQSGKPYQVFTPYWKALQKENISTSFPEPQLQGSQGQVRSDDLKDWNLTSDKWSHEFSTVWKPGEQGAWDKLESFLEKNVLSYEKGRDFPNLDTTSHLSSHLHWGEISPEQIWHASIKSTGLEAMPFLRELGWREFSTYLLYHFPDLPKKPLNPKFQDLPWNEDHEGLTAWQKGQTGYPLIDAGMRQLWRTGWMHNRVRMVVASFLIKDLLISWQRGEEWFWDTLVDADLGNNAASWQWVAGCGADAAPYFRVFNPILQSEKFDPEGNYIRKWVPELSKLSSPYIHAPWQAPKAMLEKEGIQLGIDYPFPIIDHKIARIRALEAFKSLR